MSNYPDGTTQADHDRAFMDDADYLSDDCCVECGAPADMDCDETCGRFMAVQRLREAV